MPSGTEPRSAERRVLVVSHDPAFPPKSGTDLRNHRNAVAAAAFGPVCLVSVRPQAVEAVDPTIRIEALSIDGEARTGSIGWWRIRAEHRISRSALMRLETLVQDFRPDTIVVEGIGLFKLLRPLRPLTKQLILDMHNVESDLAGQLHRADKARSAAARLATAIAIRRLEGKALSLVDRVWVCSNEDRERLMTLFPHRMPVDVVPNGIPHAGDIPETLRAQHAADNDFPVILFVGHLDYPPNVDAAKRLAGIIFPRIQAAFPAATLVIAGRRPKPAVRALAGLQGVELVEDPETMAPLLSRAHLTIIPLAAGGGTRIKILEAMAWGVPVIATPLAAEGLGFVENQELLLSDSDEELADMAVGLCLDAERRAKQRIRAHQAVWDRFGPRAIRNAVRDGLGLDEAGG